MVNLFNIGFTKKTAKEFFGIIRANNIDCLVDVRLNPNGNYHVLHLNRIYRISFRN